MDDKVSIYLVDDQGEPLAQEFEKHLGERFLFIDAAVKGHQTRRLGNVPGQASGIDLRFRGLRSPEIAVEGLRQFSCPLDGLVVDLPIFLFFDSLDLPG